MNRICVPSKTYLIKQIKKVGCFLHGDFTLKSGQKSSYYVDMRKLVSHPSLMRDIAMYTKHNILNKQQYSGVRIAGVPYGAVSIASSISEKTGIPAITIRKEVKDHGTKKQIEGEYEEGDFVYLIEDVVTTGSSVLETATILKQNGLEPVKLICLFDRGGAVDIAHKGIDVYSLFDINDFNQSPLDRLRIIAKEKETNIVFSNDLTDRKHFFKTLEEVAEHICMVKVHSDTFKDFGTNDIDRLLSMSKSYHFMILEDRKFADIGSVVKKQAEHLQINRWADFVTCHSVAGESTLYGLEDNYVLIVAQMSSKDNMIDDEYTESTIDLANKFSNVVGFIGQQRLHEKIPTFTPGVNIDASGDDLGQTYRSPEALKNKGTEFYIVGRGIYNGEDCRKAAELYQTKCWI